MYAKKGIVYAGNDQKILHVNEAVPQDVYKRQGQGERLHGTKAVQCGINRADRSMVKRWRQKQDAKSADG